MKRWRYNLDLPDHWRQQIQAKADEDGEALSERIRRYIRLGMMVDTGELQLFDRDGHAVRIIL